MLRSCYPPGWELPPATTWILGQGTLNTIELVTATAPPRPGWAPYFQQLDTYSRNLIQEATGLTAAKGELEQALKSKQRRCSGFPSIANKNQHVDRIPPTKTRNYRILKETSTIH